jgi:hypothetical protein
VLLASNPIITLTRQTLPWKQEDFKIERICSGYKQKAAESGTPGKGKTAFDRRESCGFQTVPFHDHFERENFGRGINPIADQD